MDAKKKSWTSALFAYAEGEKKQLVLSVILSVLSVMLGLVPFYCMYALICLFVAGTATAALAVKWCLLALLAYAVKIALFSLSTGTSHAMAYTILEGLRLRLADHFLHAPLGNVENHTIGEIKSMMVDKIENLEPPLAHMIPEGAGHVVLPVVSIVALLCIDWRLALASLVTFPLSFICMGLTFKISGKNFDKYDQSANYMNSTIVEYIEGIEVIKAFGRAGVSYEKYAAAINDFRTFVVKWLASTFATMKLSFALFPSTLIGTLPVALALANKGAITPPEAALAVMLSISMVGSLAKLEVFSENMRQVKFTVENLEEFLEMPELPQPEKRADIRHTDVALSHRREELGGIHRRKGGVNHVQDCKTYHRLVRRVQRQAVSGLRHDLLLPHFRRHAAGAGRLHRGPADRVPEGRNALRHLVDLEMHRHSNRAGAAPLPL